MPWPVILFIALYVSLIIFIISARKKSFAVILDRILFFLVSGLLLFSYVSFLIEPLQLDSRLGFHHEEPDIAIRDSVFYPLIPVFLLLPLMLVSNLNNWKKHFPVFPLLKVALLVSFTVFSIYLYSNYHKLPPEEYHRNFERLGGFG